MTINGKLLARVLGGMLPIAAAVVLIADSKLVTVKLRDDCDPKTFTAAGIGCVGKGETTITEFQAEFQEEGKVDDWEMTPDHTSANTGATVQVTNRGGETHTFTKVAAFGGGFVPQLNGTKAQVPECGNAPFAPLPPGPANLFVNSGQTLPGPTVGSPVLPAGKTTKFQCCIHPWMHTEITAK